MGDSSGRPYYLIALIVALLLLAKGAVSLVQAFSRVVPSGRSELTVEASPRAGRGGPIAAPDPPARNTHTALELLDALESAYTDALNEVRAGAGMTALSALDARCQEARARLQAHSAGEQAAGRWTTADAQGVRDAVDAYGQASLRLRDFTGTGQPAWVEQADALAKRARQDRAALAH